MWAVVWSSRPGIVGDLAEDAAGGPSRCPVSGYRPWWPLSNVFRSPPLYADPDIVAALRRHHVQVPDEADWQVTDAFHSYVPLPVPAALLRESCTSTSACRSTTSPCSS